MFGDKAKTTKWKFSLGDKVKCLVTGFSGIVHCRTEWLNGCIRYGVQPPLDKDGKYLDDKWLDEGQLELIVEESVKIAKEATGGPTESDPEAF